MKYKSIVFLLLAVLSISNLAQEDRDGGYPPYPGNFPTKATPVLGNSAVRFELEKPIVRARQNQKEAVKTTDDRMTTKSDDDHSSTNDHVANNTITIG